MVICTVPVQYVNRPFEVFEEMGRILKPNGPFVLTVPSLWFPPKVVRIRQEAHAFDRMEPVLGYFQAAGVLRGRHTYTVRGRPRPTDGNHFPQTVYSDSLYAVWGRRV